MRRIDRKDLRAPAYVLDLELSPSGQVSDDSVDVMRYSTMWCLSRLDGVAREISFWDVTEDTRVSVPDLRGRLRPGRPGGDQPSPGAPEPPGPPRLLEPLEPPGHPAGSSDPDMTVVICTRDRPEGLRATLASLQRQTDVGFSVLVVDNGSGSPATARAVEEMGLPRCDYVTEPRPGLARARNRALGAVRTDLVSWIDDDEVADADWVSRLKQGFMHRARPTAVCGVMLPAELESEAQVRFEQYGGFNKGRGMAPEVLRRGAPSVASPLYPLPTFGPGGNMAFRTESLLLAGGFDPRLGAGTRTCSGEETRVLSSLLSSGHVVLHWPAAITWHTHRREMAALRKQLYGYSAGLSAFYASVICSRPTAVLDIFRLRPYVLRDLRRGSQNLRLGQLPDDFPAYLLQGARRGLLEGGLMYAYEAIKDRRSDRYRLPGSMP
jgi:glycosyltransferase involved in cell wall biosynthesis